MKMDSVHVLFILLSLLFCSELVATVAPIVVGENIWQLSRRIGDTADIIETKVCNIEDKVCDTQESATEILEKTCLIPRCNFTIAQSDIPFTINTPGTYWVEENLDASAAGAFGIDVSVGSVVLDFSGHTIDGGGTVTDAVRANGISNFTIKNGVISDALVNGLEIVNSSNFRVERVDFVESATGLLLNIGTRFLVKDCNFSSQTSEGICIANSFEGLFKDINLRSPNTGVIAPALMPSNNIVFESCLCFDPIASGFLIADIDDLVFKNCQVSNAGGVGFSVDDTNRVTFDNCFASGNVADNFVVDSSADVSFVNCIAVASTTRDGFEVISSGNVTLLNCITKDNAAFGVRLVASASQVFG